MKAILLIALLLPMQGNATLQNIADIRKVLLAAVASPCPNDACREEASYIYYTLEEHLNDVMYADTLRINATYNDYSGAYWKRGGE